jgi:hypothetical protein
MNQFMVVVKLPEHFDSEFISKIPKQRALVNKLLNKGIIVSYTLSLDRTQLWIMMNGESRSEVSTIIDTFPLREYFRFEIHEVLFHEHAEFTIPQFSLN